MFLSQKSVNKVKKNLYTCVHAKKKKSSRRTNYCKDYKKPLSARKEKKRYSKKVEKKIIYDKNN
jgi:hypothetical protein